MKNNLITTIVMAFVVIVTLGALLVPTITNANTQNDIEYSNDVGTHLLMGRDDTGSHTLSWTVGESTYTFDGESYTLKSRGDFPILTDTISVLMTVSSGTPTSLSYVLPETRYTNKSVDLTMSNGTITGTIGTATIDLTYNWAYVLDENGDYFGNYGIAGTYYVNGIEDVIANYNYGVVIDGTATYKGSPATLNPVLTPVGNVFTISNDNGLIVTGSDDVNHNIGAFLIPKSITYHPKTLDPSMPLLEAIPVLVIAALLVGIVFAIIIRRNDD